MNRLTSKLCNALYVGLRKDLRVFNPVAKGLVLGGRVSEGHLERV